MSPRQVYRCPKHGEFELTIGIKDMVPIVWSCPVDIPEGIDYGAYCGEESPWIPSAPNFIGGPTTGAKKE